MSFGNSLSHCRRGLSQRTASSLEVREQRKQEGCWFKCLGKSAGGSEQGISFLCTVMRPDIRLHSSSQVLLWHHVS